ncbi:MAG: tetratricopeptide repeat protein [Ignavibacteriaceae bacterium]|nr:tetratricopeptide repeat protein [Ignavibacteriaceae bacterium]
MSTEEKNEFAYTHPKMFTRTFIPSQHVKNKEKEVFIVEYEGVTIEVFRTAKEDDPLTVYIDGNLTAQIYKNEKRTIEFYVKGTTYKLYVWNARAKNFFFSSFIFRNGIAITIDDIPVKDTLADPLLNIAEGKVGIYIFLGLLLIKAVVWPIVRTINNQPQDAVGILFIYGTFALGILAAVLIFKKNPQTGLWIGIIIGGLETVDFFYAVFAFQHGQLLGPLIWGALRTGALVAMGRSLIALRSILNITLSTQSEIQNETTQTSILLEEENILEKKIEVTDKVLQNNTNVETSNKKQNFSQQKEGQSSVSLKDFFVVPTSAIIFYLGWVFLCVLLLITDNLRDLVHFITGKYYGYDISNTNFFILFLILPVMIVYIMKVISIIRKHFSKTKELKFNNGQSPQRKSLINREIFRKLKYGTLILILIAVCSYGGYYFYNNYKAKQYYSEAMELKNKNELEKAAEKLVLAIKANNKLQNANFELGEIYQTLFDKNKKIAENLGIARYGGINLYMIETCYKNEIENNPNFIEAFKKIINTSWDRYYESDKVSEKDEVYLRYITYYCDDIIRLNSADHDTYFNKGKANLLIYWFHKMTKPDYALSMFYRYLDDAILNLNIAVEFYKYDSKTYRLLGEAYYWKYNYEKTIENFEKAISLKDQKEYPNLYYELGNAYYGVGNKTKQIENYKIAANLGDKDAMEWFERYGLSYKETGNPAKRQNAGNVEAAYLTTPFEMWKYLADNYSAVVVGYDFENFLEKAKEESNSKFFYEALEGQINLSYSRFVSKLRRKSD